MWNAVAQCTQCSLPSYTPTHRVHCDFVTKIWIGHVDTTIEHIQNFASVEWIFQNWNVEWASSPIENRHLFFSFEAIIWFIDGSHMLMEAGMHHKLREFRTTIENLNVFAVRLCALQVKIGCANTGRCGNTYIIIINGQRMGTQRPIRKTTDVSTKTSLSTSKSRSHSWKKNNRFCVFLRCCFFFFVFVFSLWNESKEYFFFHHFFCLCLSLLSLFSPECFCFMLCVRTLKKKKKIQCVAAVRRCCGCCCRCRCCC